MHERPTRHFPKAKAKKTFSFHVRSLCSGGETGGVFLYAGHLNSLRRRRFQLCSRILSAEEEGGDFFKTDREGRVKESNFNTLRPYGKKVRTDKTLLVRGVRASIQFVG